VIRGKWVLENLLGTPPRRRRQRAGAEDNTVGGALGARAAGRAPRQPGVRQLPQLMDPVGFALENFDAVGRWRTTEEGRPIDAPAACPTAASSPASPGWKQALLKAPGCSSHYADRQSC
jgi:hypothetical protein